MNKLIQALTTPTKQQQKWQNILFVGAIFTIAAFGFLVDGYVDAINTTNIL